MTPDAELAAPMLALSPRTRVFPHRAADRELAQRQAGSREQDAKDQAEEGLSFITACSLLLTRVTTFPLLGWTPSNISAVPTFTLSLVKH